MAQMATRTRHDRGGCQSTAFAMATVIDVAEPLRLIADNRIPIDLSQPVPSLYPPAVHFARGDSVRRSDAMAMPRGKVPSKACARRNRAAASGRGRQRVAASGIQERSVLTSAFLCSLASPSPLSLSALFLSWVQCQQRDSAFPLLLRLCRLSLSLSPLRPAVWSFAAASASLADSPFLLSPYAFHGTAAAWLWLRLRRIRTSDLFIGVVLLILIAHVFKGRAPRYCRR